MNIVCERAVLKGAVEIPGSKSHTIRAVAIASLAEGDSVIRAPLDSADTRSAVNTLKQANDMADELTSPFVGVAVDVYHLWWDPHLEDEIRRCGQMEKIFAFHISDWITPTTDLLNDRGLMGEGCIPIRQIKTWVEEAGFKGTHEVEIFSNRFWKMDQDDFLDLIIKSYQDHCL